ncbi:aspartate aminotransferase family protein [Cryobacterium sinapicolor]|uniref:Aspartate aminotransferase family protein n=1 Tax=Cryobacterium sinapicolor TaxID=1259236 RepID=A0ABY2JCE0_9MICO|nr:MULTISPECIES: aminotransferase class V-fold PLP-dependent enzyme [Cryobacterium]TFC84143.1 aspartate aminotransferase family protein [Cryobacterium sp. TMT3-29-2]TFD02516.1 aspartate aminotransferase family protein [Cryobacterium sinapicolor]
MSADPEDYRAALERAQTHAMRWLASVPTRPVGPQADADTLAAGFAAPLPAQPTDPAEVIDELARLSEPGLMAMPSGRFFGWVIGGTLPAALAADWLVSAWDQNAGMRFATPAAAAAEEAAGGWILDLLGLPPGADVGFTTGATMANFVGLAAGRDHVLGDAGWDVAALGLSGSPRVSVYVGEERHAVIDLALRYLGLGAPIVVASDSQGRMLPTALAARLDQVAGPAIVCLQAGNLHSGAFDPVGELTTLAHQHGAWVHVDGAFGLWAAASPRYRERLAGLDTADSWATDAHKTLQVPYDCGMAIVARPAEVRSTFGVHTSYLFADETGPGDPYEKVPELSRRARGVPVWAALRSLGRSGTVELVERLADRARAIADGLARIPGAEVLNDVVFTQVCVSFGDDELTRRVTEALLADGTTWMSGSHWQGRDVLRVSVSNWSTDAEDVALSVAAVERAVATVSRDRPTEYAE